MRFGSFPLNQGLKDAGNSPDATGGVSESAIIGLSTRLTTQTELSLSSISDTDEIFTDKIH